MQEEERHYFEFGAFRFEAEKRILWQGGEVVALPPKAADTLSFLLERRGELLEREEILNHVWKDTFVEDGNLSQSISLLRKVLGSDGSIQTIPRRGYRFSSSVCEVYSESEMEVVVNKQTISDTFTEETVELLDTSSRKKPRSLAFRTVYIKVAAGALVLAAVLVTSFAFLRNNRASVPTINSIAVLPLKNINTDSRHDSYSLGLTDSLISRLGKLNRVVVRPLSSVEKFGTDGKDAISFGKDLKVDAVLEGTIQETDDRIRVNLRLINVESGDQIWSERFDENKQDQLALQDVVSSKVARFLLVTLNDRENELLAKQPTTNPDAFALYIAGRERWARRDWKADSLPFFRKAIELDPNFALAYLGIADQMAFSSNTLEAVKALDKAVELDPTLTEAHATRGFVQMFHQWDWPGAESSLRRAIDLTPNSSKAHHWYGVYLSIHGRFDEALGEMQKALALDPTSLAVMTDIGEIYYFNHDYDRAEAELERVINTVPTFRNARHVLVKVRFKKGSSFFVGNAQAAVTDAEQMKAEGVTASDDVSHIHRLLKSGDEKALMEYSLNTLLQKQAKGDSTVNWSLSVVYAVLGENNKALTELEKVVEMRGFVLPFVAVDPIWDDVRHDKRFQAILLRMNLLK